MIMVYGRALYTIALESGVSIIMRKRANIMSLAIIVLILRVPRTTYTVFMRPFLIVGHLVSDQQVASIPSS